MPWIVAKWEWGYLTTDHDPFDSFEEACEVAEAHSHLNVLQEYTFNYFEELHERSKKTEE